MFIYAHNSRRICNFNRAAYQAVTAPSLFCSPEGLLVRIQPEESILVSRGVMTRTDYIHVDRPQQHATRRRQILQVHPDVRGLAGPTPWSGVWILALVARGSDGL